VWGDVLGAAGGVALSAGTGLLSALVPLVNAEVYALAVGATASPLVAVLCAIALAVGQTGGKWVWYTSGRKGVEMRKRSLRKHDPTPDDAEARAGRLAVLTRRLHDRRSSAGIVLLSGSVGLPPLALVAVAAGATKMRLRDFLLCCLAGRIVRFGVVLVPLALR
jgi:membrane protein YqaA with SNARE-associated domain